MFESFPEVCREYGVKADVRSLILLRKAMEKDLLHTVGDLYSFFKSVLVKDPESMGPYTRAFYHYFVGVYVEAGERLTDAVVRADSYKDWLEAFIDGDEDRRSMTEEELVERFLDEIHLTTNDIKRLLDGKDILAQDDPDMADRGDPNGDGERDVRRPNDRMADYRDVDLEELRKRMERVLEQQKSKHSGGSHWVGQGGVSPYGNKGNAQGGIRVGGSGGGKMARAVLEDASYYPVDINANINDDNIDAALAALKGVREESNDLYLDIPLTVKTGVKEGGLFLPIEQEKINDRLQVLLFIDNGGYSMDYFIRPVQALFKKMKTRYQHDLETYYFHNTIYTKVYEDERRMKGIPIERILKKNKEYRVFVIGDASMAPYELNQQSLQTWVAFKKHFKKIAWLNPIPQKHWRFAHTTEILKQVIPMFTMTPKGIEEAVRDMNRKMDSGIKRR